MKIIVSERQYNLLYEQPESVMDSRVKELTKTMNDLPKLSLDDTIDVISAAIETVPGVGNLISMGIDGIHGLSYVVRFLYSKEPTSQIENASLAVITLAGSFLPVGGNAASIAYRRGIQGVLRLTPSEIMMAGQKLGLVNKTKFFLSKTTWKYSIILFLAKAFRSKLAEALSFCIKKLYEIYNQIKNLDKFKILSGSVLSFISLLKEFSDDAEFAVKLVEKGNL